MLHWYGTGSGGSAAAAPCSFSILFPVSDKQAGEEAADGGGAASSSVDCTLSLGTPYTRQHPSSSSSAMQWSSPLCWDKVTHPGKHSTGTINATGGSAVAAAAGGVCANLGGDPLLLARRCANCDTTSTPLWRNGPRGPKSLCNACGIRYKKEERRAAASSTNSCHTAMAAPALGEGISYAYGLGQSQHPWGCYAPAAAASKSSVIYGGGDEGDEQGEMYLPWRLNVAPPQFPVGDRAGLFQYQ